MSRYVNEIQVPFDPNILSQPIYNYMTNEGFKLYNYKGTQLWKKGVGLATAPQYLVILYTQNSIKIEAFIKYALFPGVYIGEMGTAGFFGAVPKSLLKTRVQTIEGYVWQLITQQQNAMQNQQ